MNFTRSETKSCVEWKEIRPSDLKLKTELTDSGFLVMSFTLFVLFCNEALTNAVLNKCCLRNRQNKQKKRNESRKSKVGPEKL